MKRYLYITTLAAMLAGCGGTTGGSSSPQSFVGTQGPGDVWSWTLQGSTFSAVNQTKNFHYSGTESTLATGFMKLTVTTTDDPNVSIGQSAYALELPGTALMLKMAGDDVQPPVVAGALGSNPAGPTASFNFVAVGGSAFDASTSQAYGHVTFDVSGNSLTGVSHHFTIDGTPLPDGPCTFTGDNGMMTDTGDNPATGAMTPSGVCVLDYGPNMGGVIGVKQPAANVDLADVATKHFKGFLINSGKTQCVDVTPNGDGTLHGAGYSLGIGVETGTFDNGSGVTVTFNSQPNPGEVPVTISTTGGDEQLVAAINVVGGKYMLFCFGVGQDGRPYNVVLVEV